MPRDLTASSSVATWAGFATTRRSMDWATSGAVHWTRSTGLEAISSSSTAYPSTL
ncbi:hypothetical protein ACFW0V_27010 [Micromonospora parva]|uniref:hypothetical protein n=1 Tax=Micromonospora parva TaxID=1464048 RepID=UPI00366DDD30